ncbi:DUF982 domain-containing protein (plasmid) [Cereibacter azotoformans]|uniref:DUF982 domain-containing protein n=1 Tax=Cereibacter sphaeroides (strain ATCC 17025 / ATH 2.4.3) TaxID=349102 RepID=A4X0H3_CERS5|nr:DUF982 domain-containing protein [Cereibacter azotoformans]ULB12595.1 DUF982 domain-containing protein [Cereibacter azotoformans]
MLDRFEAGPAIPGTVKIRSRVCRSSFMKDIWLIEINWGPPLSLVISPDGDVQKFSTIEQVKYWLLKRWPIADDARSTALKQVDAAMNCIVPVGVARRAFAAAARSAGFIPEDLVGYTARRAAG